VDIFKQVLGDISGSRVLDVATREGGFVELLVRNLENYVEVIGIDTDEHAIKVARSAFDPESIWFCQMDAEHLAFEDESFDTVNISASLHHLANVPRVLAEMKRVLRPGGHFIISEMHRDGQTESQLAVISMHRWVAEIDSALGVIHNRTLARQEIVDYGTALGLCNIMYYDFSDVDSDPMDEATVERLEGAIDKHIQRARGLPNYEALKQQGQELRQRLHDAGVQWEPILIMVGEKQ
jgi:SAM-dependent methyltransferase